LLTLGSTPVLDIKIKSKRKRKRKRMHVA